MLFDHYERNVMLTMILGAFVLAVVVASVLSHRLVNDLGHMADAAQLVAAGDLAARTGVTRADELGTTARAFDDMAAELEETERRREATEEERRLLVASISHDLRTPISAIRAALEAIEDGVGDRDRLLSAAQCDVRALTGLVDDLFLLAQLDAGRYEPATASVDLAEIVDEAVESLQPTAHGSGVEIDVQTAGRRQVIGSERELGRVVRNLLANAIRHSPDGSTVSVRLRQNEHTGATDQASISLSVVDEGPGFPGGLIDTATEPFVRGDAARARATGGAGLGLSIAAGVVEAHGGELSLHPGPGGSVEIALPVLAG
ncbi:MAG: HAMP domain-containing sensor histidine kinase [Actinomycetota bacterium]|jgi:signal transduction histidine kinase|nr:HAMP domain-containing sensor histidine kinase [Actinomycetota bacterium]